MARDNGGVIGVPNVPTSTTATGVWSIDSQYQAKVTDTWPQRALFTTKSCRFNSGSSDYLNRTPDAGNRKTWTWSCWVKRSNVTTRHDFFSAGTALNNTDTMAIRFDSGSNLTLAMYSSDIFQTSQLFRDASAWYHMVLAIDTTQSTDTNRVKLYINGTQVTDFNSISYPSQNADLGINGNVSHNIGRLEFNDSFYLDGYLSEVCFIDGTALDPTSFGVANSDGVWTPIPYTGTFGTNGFNLQFENAAALGEDSSPNGNTFTVNNLTSIDQSTDYPVVNYATYNPLINTQNIPTFAEGNLQAATTGAGVNGGFSTTGMSSGKWYAEFKLSAHSGTNRCIIGVTSNPAEENRNNQYLGQTAASYSYSAEIGRKYYNNTAASYGDSYTTNDIIGIALDLDNLKIYFSKNGTWQNSGDPESGATGTGAAFTVTAPSSTTTGFYFFGEGDESGTHSVTVQANFGSPPYAISSGNADGNGYGNFEYAPPSGYYALNTANLAEFG